MDARTVASAAAAGAALGTVAGATTGYLQARSEIEKIPVDQVTVSWREPITEDVTLGSIPKDQYFRFRGSSSACWGSRLSHRSYTPDLTPSETVVRPVPILGADGNPQYRQVTETFEGRGASTVHVDQHEASIPRLDPVKPFHQIVEEDRRSATCSAGNDSDGNPQTRSVRYVRGVDVLFRPNVQETPVAGEDRFYETRRVTFDHGVDVGAKVLRGALIGAGIGTVIGLVAETARQQLASRG